MPVPKMDFSAIACFVTRAVQDQVWISCATDFECSLSVGSHYTLHLLLILRLDRLHHPFLVVSSMVSPSNDLGALLYFSTLSINNQLGTFADQGLRTLVIDPLLVLASVLVPDVE